MSKAKGFHKKPSKRVTLKRKYKIEKKVREHNRKVKKLARKNAKNGNHVSKAKQSVTMPRSAPFSLEWDGSTFKSNKEKKLQEQELETAQIVSSLAPAFDPSSDIVEAEEEMKDDAVDDAESVSRKIKEVLKSKRNKETNQLLGLQVNKERRNRIKRENKKKNKKDRLEEKDESMDDEEGNYNFETDFS